MRCCRAEVLKMSNTFPGIEAWRVRPVWQRLSIVLFAAGYAAFTGESLAGLVGASEEVKTVVALLAWLACAAVLGVLLNDTAKTKPVS